MHIKALIGDHRFLNSTGNFTAQAGGKNGETNLTAYSGVVPEAESFIFNQLKAIPQIPFIAKKEKPKAPSAPKKRKRSSTKP